MFDESWACLATLFGLTTLVEGEGEVAVFSAKRWDHRNSLALIESATPCHDALRCWWDLNPIRLTVLDAKSVDYNTAPQHLQVV